MRTKMKARWLILSLVLASLPVLFVAHNASADYEWGCFICRYDFWPTSPTEECRQVGDGESGEAIQCDDEFGFCRMKGGACDNIVVTPGGGSGGSTGGGSGGGWGGGSGIGGGGVSSPGCTLIGFGNCPIGCNTCTVILK